MLRAYFEYSGARKRGMILREDQLPIGKEHPAPTAGVTIVGSPTAVTDETTDPSEGDQANQDTPVDDSGV